MNLMVHSSIVVSSNNAVQLIRLNLPLKYLELIKRNGAKVFPVMRPGFISFIYGIIHRIINIWSLKNKVCQKIYIG
jgi:hypothetical protein